MTFFIKYMFIVSKNIKEIENYLFKISFIAFNIFPFSYFFNKTSLRRVPKHSFILNIVIDIQFYIQQLC